MLKRRQGRRAARKGDREREKERGEASRRAEERRERRGEKERARVGVAGEGWRIAAREGESPRTASDGFELGEVRAQKRHPSHPLRAFDGTPPPP